MKILGVDTSCGEASCGLFLDGSIHVRKASGDKRKHSASLMPMVQTMLDEHGLKASDMDLFAVSSGPGSFTGLRIGMAAIKGLAYSLGKNVCMIKTLDVLANRYEQPRGMVCPVIDARNEQVYTALYDWKDGMYKPVTGYMGRRISDLAAILSRENRETTFCGDASIMYIEYFRKVGIKCKEPDMDALYPSAGVLVRMAAAGAGDIVGPDEAVPFYLRKSQAERLYGKK